MEEIIRNVSELSSDERHACELAVGHELQENQQLIIQIHAIDESTRTKVPSKAIPGNGSRGSALPDWCNVYDGLSDAEIAAIEADILERADLTRSSG